METILEIINSIATIEFMSNFEFLVSKENAEKDKYKYLNLLEKWYLFREKKLVENYNLIIQKTAGKKSLIRTLNQDIFKLTYNDKKELETCYNEKRISEILRLIETE